MIKEGKFGVQEAVSLLVITSVAKVFYTSPAMVMKVAGTAGWYMTLVSAMVAGIGFIPLWFLLKRFPNKNIMDIYDIVLGRIGGFIFSLVLFLLILATLTANIREYTEVLVVYIFPLSPPQYLITLLFVVIILAAYLGLETIARLSKLFGGILLLGLMAVLLLTMQNYDINHLFPFYGYGVKAILSNGFLRSSAYGDLIIISIIVKSLQGISHVKKAGSLSLIITAAIIPIVILAFSLSFPYDTGREVTAPMYLMTTLINYGPFFQRLESIFLYIWNISLMISSSALFYMLLMVYSHMFNIKDKRPMIVPLAIILFSLTLMVENISRLITVYLQLLRTYGWVFFFLPPTFALLIAIIKGKKGDAESA